MGYLLTLDISKWRAVVIPTTTLRSEMKEMSLTPPIKFALDIARVDTGILDFDTDWNWQFKKDAFFSHFRVWCSTKSDVYSRTESAFYAEMKKVGIVPRTVWVDTKSTRGVKITLPELQAALRLYMNDPTYSFK